MKAVFLLSATLLLALPSAWAQREPISVKISVKSGKDSVDFPEVTTPQNRAFQVKMLREWRVPARWDLPRIEKQPNGQQLYIPVLPEMFDTLYGGWVFDCNVDVVEDGLIRLAGTATYTEPELNQAVFGEKAGPIYSDKKVLLTQNKGESGSATSSISYFQLFAKPGKPYTIRVRRLAKWANCIVVCTFAGKEEK